ncbi:aldo/keto reductase [Mucilaginibacter puniceus]
MQATNKLILGTVQFGLDYGINNTSGKPDQDSVNSILNAAYQAGITTLDTAEVYGNAHDIIGNFHKKYPHQIFDVITKLPDEVGEAIDKKIELYLQQLNITQIHGLLFHSYNSYLENIDSLPLLSEYKNKGKIKYLGVSIYTNAQMEVVIDDDRIDIIQLPFNLFDNVNTRGNLIKKAKEKGKIIHTRSAFLQGLFFLKLHSDNKIVKALHKELTYIHQLSDNYKIPLQKLALNYCLQQHNIDNVLIGVDNLYQLSQNVSYADNNLNNQVIASIDDIVVEDVDLLNPSLWN